MQVEMKLTTADTAGTNLSAGETWAKNSRRVRIKGISLVGSTALKDMELDIYYGTVKVANIMNSRLLVGKDFNRVTDWYYISSQKYCPAGTRINIEVVTAPQADAWLCVDIVEV